VHGTFFFVFFSQEMPYHGLRRGKCMKIPLKDQYEQIQLSPEVINTEVINSLASCGGCVETILLYLLEYKVFNFSTSI